MNASNLPIIPIVLVSAYVALGTLSNLCSLRHRVRAGRTLTPLNPITGLVVMLLTAIAAALHFQSLRVGTAMLVLLLVLMLWGGVYRHCFPADRSAYASPMSRWSAVAINLFGVVAVLCALLA